MNPSINAHDNPQSHACGQFASLVPLLDDPNSDLTAAEVTATRNHLRGCPACQARQAQYASLDQALRAHYGVASVTRRPTEDIMRHIHERTDETADPPMPHTPSTTTQTLAGRFLRGIGAVACIAALIAVTFALFSSRVHVGPGGKTYSGPPAYTFAGTTGSIASISMLSPTEGWALAQTLKTPKGARPAKEVTLYHYLDGKWFPVYVPISEDFSTTGPNGNGGPGGFNGTISMDSPTDGWADVHNFNRVAVLLHYTGGTWHEVLNPGAYVGGIQALSPHSVWAMGWPKNETIPCPGAVNPGTACMPPGVSLLRFDDTSWRPQSFPASIGIGSGGSILFYHMTSDSSGWALAQIGTEPSSGNGTTYAILLDNGSTWSVLSTYTIGELTNLTSFSMASDTEGWALGQRIVADASGSTTNVPAKQVLYHFVNGHWSEVSLPISGSTFTTLQQITMLSSSNGWIVGSAQSAYPGATVADFQAHTVLFHYTNGAWQQVQTPDVNAPVDAVQGLAFTADGNGWAAGYSADVPASQTVQTDDIPDSAAPMLWTYRNGAWSVYHQ